MTYGYDLEPLFFGNDTNFKCTRNGDTTWVEFIGNRGISFELTFLEANEIQGMMSITDYDAVATLPLTKYRNYLNSSSFDEGVCELSADYFIFQGSQVGAINDFHIKIPFSQSTR